MVIIIREKEIIANQEIQKKAEHYYCNIYIIYVYVLYYTYI